MNAQIVAEIKNTVSAVFNVDPAAMNANTGRRRIYARPRQVAMTLTREMTDMSLPAIARAFRFEDHTTVVHAIRRVRELSEQDPEFGQVVDLARMRYQLGTDHPSQWVLFRTQLLACIAIAEGLAAVGDRERAAQFMLDLRDVEGANV